MMKTCPAVGQCRPSKAILWFVYVVVSCWSSAGITQVTNHVNTPSTISSTSGATFADRDDKVQRIVKSASFPDSVRNSSSARMDAHAQSTNDSLPAAYLQTAFSGGTGSLVSRDNAIRFPVMFTTSASYLVTKHKLYGKFSIYFKMKTTQSIGLVLYSGVASSKDFMAIEIVGGQLRYVFDVGSGVRVVQPVTPRPVNDNRWHEVTVVRPSVTQHVLRVDEVDSLDHLPDTRSVHYDLAADDLYVGGLPRTMFGSGLGGGLARQVKSRHGFQGCLASLVLDGVAWKMAESRVQVPEEHRKNIKEGCVGPTDECSASVCANGGVCVQQWNSYACDCEMTSFTGPKCNDDSVSFRFGGLGGVITMALTDREDSKSDRLALGFILAPSPQLHQHHHHQHLPLHAQLLQPATLLRLSSTTSNDFIQVEMSEGVVSVVYNMGKVAHRVSESSLRVDDGQYHVVRFIRSGPNSSLQVDNLPPQRKHPTGKQLTTFNQQGVVSIGASKDQSGRVVRPFHGIIAGVMLNGLWLLELVAEGDARATVEGDIDLNVTPLKSNQLSLYLAASFTPHSPEVATSKLATVRANYQRRPAEEPGFFEKSSSSSSIGCLNDDDEECVTMTSSSRDKRLGSDVTKSARQSSPRPTSSTADPTIRSLRHSCLQDDGDDCASGDEDLTSDPEGQSPVKVNDKFNRVHEQPTKNPSAIQLGPSNSSSSLTSTSRRGSSAQPGQGRASLPLPTRSVPQTKTPSSSDSLRTSRATPANQSKPLLGANSRSGTGRSSSSFGRNVALIAGIASGTIVLVLVLCYVVYRYRGHEEGSYKLDTVDSYDPGALKPSLCSIGGTSSSGGVRTARQIREWYV